MPLSSPTSRAVFTCLRVPQVHLGLLYETCREDETWCQLAAVGTNDRLLRLFFARLADQRSAFSSALRTALDELGGQEASQTPPGVLPERRVAAILVPRDQRRALLAATLGGEQIMGARYLHALAVSPLQPVHRDLVSKQYTAVMGACDTLCELLHPLRSAAA